MKKILLAAVLLISAMANTSAQTAISAAGMPPDASAMLDVIATDKGFLAPRINLVAVNNSATPIASPADGLLVYNMGAGGVATKGFYYWDATNSLWQKLISGNGSFVTGTGAATRVAFWNSSTDLTSSANLYWDNVSNRLGVNTASPQNNLHVNGGMRWGGQNAPYIYSNEDASGIYFEQVGTTTANSRIRLQSSPSGSQATYAQFFVDPVNGFSFLTSAGGNSGYVGVGTASPIFKTHVVADVTMDGDITPGTSQLALGGSATVGKRMLLGYDTNGNGFGFIKAGNYGVTWTPLSLQPNGGNVGIATTAPAAKLDVVGTSARVTNSGDAKFEYFGSGSDRGFVGWQATAPAGVYLLNKDNSPIYFGTTNAERMRIDAAGNVGIGTTAPGNNRLRVISGSQVQSSIYTDGYTEDVSGILDGNYVPSHTWAPGTGSIGIFGMNGTAAENTREWGDGPGGNRALLWKGNGSGNNDDGGWNTSLFTIDNTKTYRVSVWVKKTGANTGTTYFGCYGGASDITYLNGTTETNPYFYCGTLPALDRWYLIVGYIHGSGDANTTTYAGGVYDGVTGQKVISLNSGGNCSTDFKFKNTATQQQQRAYLYYNTNAACNQYFFDPRFEEVSGKEIPVSSLLGVDAPSSGGSGYIQNQNSTVQSANFIISATGRADGDFRAPIFYDQNDVGYYLDPNTTSNSALRIRGGALHGPNPTWGAYLYVGSDGRQGLIDGSAPSVAATNGNLHIDAGSGYETYINYYDGVNIHFGRGNNSDRALLDGNGLYLYDGWFRNYGGVGLYNQSYGNHWYAEDANYWVSRTDRGFSIRNVGNSQRGYVYHDNGSNFGLLSQDGNWKLRVSNGDVEAYTYFYGPTSQIGFIYDRDNTGYYWDGNSTSRMYYGDFNYLHTQVNDSWFPYTGNNWNYFRGSTYAWNAVWYDENNTGYYIDPSGSTRFYNVNNLPGFDGYYPSNSVIRHTPNLHFNSLAGYAVIANWDNGTSGATQTFRTTGDGFYVYADGQTFSSNWFRPLGSTGLYFQSYGGGWYMQDGTWIRNYNDKQMYYNTAAGDNTDAIMVDQQGATQDHSLSTENDIYGFVGYSNRRWWVMYAYAGFGTSSLKYKTDVQELSNSEINKSLADVNKIQSIRYKWNKSVWEQMNGNHVDSKHHEAGEKPDPNAKVPDWLGFSVESLPEGIVDETGENYQYGAMLGLLVSSTKALTKRTEILADALDIDFEKMKTERSVTKNISDFGTATTRSQETTVTFSPDFIKQLNGKTPAVTVSSSDVNVHLSVTDKSATGFKVISSNAKPVAFDYIAMGKITIEFPDYATDEKKPVSKTDIAAWYAGISKTTLPNIEDDPAYIGPDKTAVHDPKANDADELIKIYNDKLSKQTNEPAPPTEQVINRKAEENLREYKPVPADMPLRSGDITEPLPVNAGDSKP